MNYNRNNNALTNTKKILIENKTTNNQQTSGLQMNYKSSESKAQLKLIERINSPIKEIINKEIPSYNSKFRPAKDHKNINGIFFCIKHSICNRLLKNKHPKEVAAFDLSRIYFEERLDITYYLRVLERVDNMKNLLFNNKQSLCFDYFKKPNLFEDVDIAKIKRMCGHLYSSKEQDINKLQTYFKDRSNKNELDEIDIELMEKVDINLDE